MRSLWVGAILAVLVVLIIATILLLSENQTSEFVGNSMLADITIIGEPKVGNTFMVVTTLYLKYRYMGLWDIANDTIIYLVLPNGVEVVSGDINWTGDILAYTNKTLQTHLKILQEGEYTIHAYAKGPSVGSGSFEGFHTQIYIESYNNSYKIMPWKPIPNVVTGITVTIDSGGKINETV